MNNNNNHRIKLISVGLIVLPTLLGTLAKADDETRIMVTNCASSRHVVDVWAYDNNSPNKTSSAHIHSGSQAQVHCKTTECKLKFLTNKQSDRKLVTSAPDAYVHVQDDDKISSVGTDEKSVCNGS